MIANQAIFRPTSNQIPELQMVPALVILIVVVAEVVFSERVTITREYHLEQCKQKKLHLKDSMEVKT